MIPTWVDMARVRIERREEERRQGTFHIVLDPHEQQVWEDWLLNKYDNDGNPAWFDMHGLMNEVAR